MRGLHSAGHESLPNFCICRLGEQAEALHGAAEENFTVKEMKRRIEGIDRERAKYYSYFSSRKWGARDTSGIDSLFFVGRGLDNICIGRAGTG